MFFQKLIELRSHKHYSLQMTKNILLILCLFLTLQLNAFAIDFFDKKEDEPGKKGGDNALIMNSQKRVELPGVSCPVIPALIRAFLKTHVLDRDMNDEIIQHTADQFLKHLEFQQFDVINNEGFLLIKSSI